MQALLNFFSWCSNTTLKSSYKSSTYVRIKGAAESESWKRGKTSNGRYVANFHVQSDKLRAQFAGLCDSRGYHSTTLTHEQTTRVFPRILCTRYTHVHLTTTYGPHSHNMPRLNTTVVGVLTILGGFVIPYASLATRYKNQHKKKKSSGDLQCPREYEQYLKTNFVSGTSAQGNFASYDVLGFVNQRKISLPVQSRMAIDILRVPNFFVTSESAFITQVVDVRQSEETRLTPRVLRDVQLLERTTSTLRSVNKTSLPLNYP
ncbi:zinc finger BED domain-containing protein RICESLEEPER 2 [Tanacetum coccineum]|uniref:Zinc finger BED domain-containing protein RICESLEEPER 2 n=1 Tax=Tanacetum coccineum TaxID=301880 RepID=A0ABQ5CR13_9ASTR